MMLHPAPKMNSPQEQIAEEFMSQSMGASYIFSPEKYKYEGNEGEPFDLAWVSKDLVVLFNFTSKKRESKRKQQRHNIEQLEGYLKRWKTGEKIFNLRGTNRAGGKCDVAFKDVRNLILVSVVSKSCGVELLKRKDDECNELWLNVPDKFIQKLSPWSATIIDFMGVAWLCLDAGADTMDTFNTEIDGFIRRSISKAKYHPKVLSPEEFQDFEVVRNTLGSLKHLSPENGIIFADLSIEDTVGLTNAVLQAIDISEPPLFKNWVVMEYHGIYYRFIISTCSLGSSNNDDFFRALDKAMQSPSTKAATIMITYNYVEGADYRTFATLGIPELPISHACVLFDRLMKFSPKFESQS